MSARDKILIVEDETPIREGLAERLEAEGYRVVAVDTVEAGIAALDRIPDLVILDRRLPDGEGLEVLREARERGSEMAFLVLSARGMPEDRVEGLEDGADDYVTKPFHLRELIARVQNLLGRTAGTVTGSGAARLPFGAFELDLGDRVLRNVAHDADRDVELTKLEFDLLFYFLRNAQRAISRNELLDRVWGYDRYPTTRTVDFHVLSLRKKIEPPGRKPRFIQTVQGVGYRFEP